MKHFSEMEVWKRSHKLVLRVYELTRSFPVDERFGLVSQSRRAAVSVPANIAEGSKRSSAADAARFMNTAEASLAELDYELLLARDLDYLTQDAWRPLHAEAFRIGRMLARLRQALTARARPNR